MADEFENINMKVYFYVNGTDKILLETAYCSIYGLSGENGISKEAISSNNASKAYLYKNFKESVNIGLLSFNLLCCIKSAKKFYFFINVNI